MQNRLSFVNIFFCTPKVKFFANTASTIAFFLLTSCTYSPNYSKVDASDHSVKNNYYSARQMAVGLPNQQKDSMVITTEEDGENTSQEPIQASPHPYSRSQFERGTSSPQNSLKYDTSYVAPNPFAAVFGIFSNAIKNFSNRMAYASNRHSVYNTGNYNYQSPSNSYVGDYQQNLRRHGIYGPQNSLEAQANYNATQALNNNNIQ